MYKIPLFDLNFDDREAQAAYDVIKSGWISTGPKCIEFENRFKEMFGCKYAVSLANCTCALHLAMLILGIKEGDEVIVPSLTFVATANAVRYVGAKPVFADVISLQEPTIDPEDIKAKITGKTKAIIVMHYAGFPCRMHEIMAIANKHSLKVVEDACHGPLSEYLPCGIDHSNNISYKDSSIVIQQGKGKKLGTIGDIGCFSFFSNKNISTGEGGMLVTNDGEYNKQARLLRSHGMSTLSYERAKGHATEYDVVRLGYNYRLDDIHASIGLVQLDKLEKDLTARSRVRNWYLDKLSDIDEIIIPFEKHKGLSSNYIFIIILKDGMAEKRNKLRAYLHKYGIQSSIHYIAAHTLSIYRDNSVSLPETQKITNSLITLPMYSSLKEAEVDYIAKIIKEGLAKI